MQELLGLLPTRDSIGTFIAAPDTWRQVAIIAGGAIVAWSLSFVVHRRAASALQPGAMADGVHRTAVRTGLLALTPILLWLWLLAASAILRRYGLDTQILRPAML